MNTTPVPLSELFDFPAIRGVTEDFIIKHPGAIPVYGGKMTETPVGYIEDNLESVRYFQDCLAWNREGSVGFVFYHHHRFSTNDHHRPLVLKNEYKTKVNLEYAQIVLQEHLLSQGFKWSKTASKEKVKAMSIELPIDDFGEIDVAQQIAYVSKWKKISEAQRVVSAYADKIKNSVVVLDKHCPIRTVYLSDKLFRVSIGKRVLKKEVFDVGIPLYSANPNIVFGYVKTSNIESFENESILWGIDGNFQWSYIPRNTMFATTDHCGRLEVLDDRILSEYVFYQLREASASYGFNRTFRASLQNIGNVSVDIPVDDNGEYDVDMQRTLIKRYQRINTVKEKTIRLLEEIISKRIDI